jgi:hypothetical protein
MLTYGSAAPSNFDIYNKAEALTRPEAIRAFGGTAKAKVLPASPTTPVPTPVVNATSLKATGGLATAPSESVAPVAKPQPQAQPQQQPQPQPQQPSTYTPSNLRPLPQLQFVPRAEPLPNPGQTIQFEDEKSKL